LVSVFARLIKGQQRFSDGIFKEKNEDGVEVNVA